VPAHLQLIIYLFLLLFSIRRLLLQTRNQLDKETARIIISKEIRGRERMEIRLALTRKTTRRTLIWFVTGILMLFVRVSAKTSSYTMDAILVFHGYNRLLCIDVYLPDVSTSMRLNHICTWWMAALLEKAIWLICQLCITADRWFTAWSAISQMYSLAEPNNLFMWRRTL